MEDLENKMAAILNDPNIMEKLMSVAKSLGQSSPEPETSNYIPPAAENFSAPDLSLLKLLPALRQESGIDTNQMALLQALHPYLSRERIGKLEKAMRAARIARFATTFLNSGALSLLWGGESHV